MGIVIALVLATVIIVVVDSIQKRNRILRVAKALSYLSAVHCVSNSTTMEMR